LHENGIINIYPFNEGEASRVDDYFKVLKTKRYILDEKSIKVNGNTVSMQDSGSNTQTYGILMHFCP
jgi:hypothetical protein